MVNPERRARNDLVEAEGCVCSLEGTEETITGMKRTTCFSTHTHTAYVDRSDGKCIKTKTLKTYEGGNTMSPPYGDRSEGGYI